MIVRAQLLVASSLLVLGACAAVVGLEDRKLLPAADGGDARVPPPPVIECAATQLLCGTQCKSRTDPANCTSCGNACAASQVCAPGGCASTCAVSATLCGRSCVDLVTDPDHCGSCGNACEAPPFGFPTCSARTCGFRCNVGYSPCNGTACCPNAAAPALGDHHGCVIVDDGIVRCWGDNQAGQLGVELPTSSPDTAIGASAITGAKRIAAGGESSCAIDSADRVSCWGSNADGMLGVGTGRPNAKSPVSVTGISSPFDVMAGQRQVCALVSGGGVTCWGAGIERSVPTPAAGVTDAAAIAVGAGHACMIQVGGLVKCWGANGFGQLGNGTFDPSVTPVPVAGIAGVVRLASYANHTCALIGGTREVKCWGANAFGQLGDGTNTSRSSPVKAPVTDVLSIAVGADHSCAVDASAFIKCWGANDAGQLGDGTKNASTTPVAGPNVLASSVAAGAKTTCARIGDRVRCWGARSTTSQWPAPTDVDGVP